MSEFNIPLFGDVKIGGLITSKVEIMSNYFRKYTNEDFNEQFDFQFIIGRKNGKLECWFSTDDINNEWDYMIANEFFLNKNSINLVYKRVMQYK